MRFEWDEAKNRANKLKHGISFEMAATVFDDPDAITEDDRDSFGEARWRTIGRSQLGTHLFVIHADRTMMDGEETTRIISARKAGKEERRRYERRAAYR